MVRLVIAGLVAAAAGVTFGCSGGGMGNHKSTSALGGTPGTAATVRAIKTLKYDRGSLVLAAGQLVAARFVSDDTRVSHEFAVYKDPSHSQLVAKTDICTAPRDEQLQLDLIPESIAACALSIPSRWKG